MKTAPAQTRTTQHATFLGRLPHLADTRDVIVKAGQKAIGTRSGAGRCAREAPRLELTGLSSSAEPVRNVLEIRQECQMNSGMQGSLWNHSSYQLEWTLGGTGTPLRFRASIDCPN